MFVARGPASIREIGKRAVYSRDRSVIALETFIPPEILQHSRQLESFLKALKLASFGRESSCRV